MVPFIGLLPRRVIIAAPNEHPFYYLHRLSCSFVFSTNADSILIKSCYKVACINF